MSEISLEMAGVSSIVVIVLSLVCMIAAEELTENLNGCLRFLIIFTALILPTCLYNIIFEAQPLIKKELTMTIQKGASDDEL